MNAWKFFLSLLALVKRTKCWIFVALINISSVFVSFGTRHEDGGRVYGNDLWRHSNVLGTVRPGKWMWIYSSYLSTYTVQFPSAEAYKLATGGAPALVLDEEGCEGQTRSTDVSTSHNTDHRQQTSHRTLHTPFWFPAVFIRVVLDILNMCILDIIHRAVRSIWLFWSYLLQSVCNNNHMPKVSVQ